MHFTVHIFSFVDLTRRSDSVELFESVVWLRYCWRLESPIPQDLCSLLFSVKNCLRIDKSRSYTNSTVRRSYNVHGRRSTMSPLLISSKFFSSSGAILDPDTYASRRTPEHTPSVVTNDYLPRVPLKHICPLLTSMFLHTPNMS